MIGAAFCVAHRGRHGVFNGECVIPARERQQRFRWRFSACERCGADLDHRTDVQTGRTDVLTAGTDTPHWHEPAVTVRLDPDDLADAIVRASRAARAERQTAQTSVQTPAQTVFAGHEGRPDGDVSVVDVVRPDGPG